VVLVQVLFLGLADDLARDVAGALEGDERGVLEEDGPERFAVLALDDDPVAETQPQRARVQEEIPARTAQGDLDDLRHDRTSMAAPAGVRLTPPATRAAGDHQAASGAFPAEVTSTARRAIRKAPVRGSWLLTLAESAMPAAGFRPGCAGPRGK